MHQQLPANKQWLYRLVTHPLVMVASFLAILVGGKYMAMVYMQTLITGFLQKELFGLFGVVGIIVLVLNYYLAAGLKEFPVRKFVFNISGAVLMLASLIVFYVGAPWENIAGSFRNPVALATNVVFVVLWVCFMFRQGRELAGCSRGA